MRGSGQRFLSAWAWVAIGLGIGGGSLGCGDDGGGGTPTFPVDGANVALVRAAHLSPDAGPANVTVRLSTGETFTLNGVEFGDLSAYQAFEVDFRGADASVDVTVGGETYEADFTIVRGDVVTLAAVGLLTPTRREETVTRDGSIVEALTLEDVFRLSVLRGRLDTSGAEARVSFVHAAPSEASLRLTAFRTPSPGLLPDLEFGTNSQGSARIAQDRYGLEFRRPDSGDVITTFAPTLLRAGSAQSIWAVEKPDGVLTAWVTVDDYVPGSTTPPTPVELERLTSFVRFANFRHLRPTDTGEAYFFFDGKRLDEVEGFSPEDSLLAQTEFTGVAEILRANHALEARRPAPFFTPLIENNVLFEPGELLTFVMYTAKPTPSTLPDVPATVILDHDLPVPDESLAAIRPVFTAFFTEDLYSSLERLERDGSVTTYQLDRVTSDARVADFEQVPAGDWDVVIRRDVEFGESIQGPAPVDTLEITLEPGAVVTAFLYGNPRLNQSSLQQDRDSEARLKLFLFDESDATR